MQKITSNKVLENISVIQLSEVLCELDLMGALENEPWRLYMQILTLGTITSQQQSNRQKKPSRHTQIRPTTAI